MLILNNKGKKSEINSQLKHVNVLLKTTEALGEKREVQKAPFKKINPTVLFGSI